MKLSLAWIFDHIDADWRTIDVNGLVNSFNQKVAEIEGFEKIALDLNVLAVAKVKNVSGSKVAVHVPEWHKDIELERADTNNGECYLVARTVQGYGWATFAHMGGTKDGLLPAFYCDESEVASEWKQHVEPHDYILHLDNKSVNHRPDMWGHRGVAREVAALLNLPHRPLDQFLVPLALKEGEDSVTADEYTVSIKNPQLCKKFAVLPLLAITNRSSKIGMAARLIKVDSRPINTVVDITNYVMLDLGQPMHAFDGATIDKKIMVRLAANKEKLTVLDGQTVELTDHDCVVADSKKPISLAGIMGGKETAVSLTTQTVLLEAACFDATTIRKTAAQIKKRTEASARFEKSLDPYGPVWALQRFLKLLTDQNISYTSGAHMLVVGPVMPAPKITILHAYIEQLLGVSIAPRFVIDTLKKIEFDVVDTKGTYTVTVPSFRATKDIAIKQDIIEEVGRFYGYENLASKLPEKSTIPFDLTTVIRKRAIKELLAYGFGLQEVYTYAFFDEAFLSTLNWQPGPTLKVQEAVSSNWQRLVTTLIPNLLKVVASHAPDCDTMCFFEWAQIWPEVTVQLQEKSSLAAIFVDQKKPIDFYQMKQKLCVLARLLGICFEWVKAESTSLPPWYLSHQTAYLMYQGTKIGIAGMANPSFLVPIAAGHAFIFELDGDFLLSFARPLKRYEPAPKYPPIHRDISLLVPLTVTVTQLRQGLKNITAIVTQVALVDFFQKPEWKDTKSLTFRITMVDPHATMTTAQADKIMEQVVAYVQQQGATVR